MSILAIFVSYRGSLRAEGKQENVDAPAYVAVPNGKLIEYHSDGSQRLVPAEGLAADPRSRWSDIDERYHADLELLE